MNRQEIAEIRRRLNLEKNNISCIRGCYVNAKGEIVSMFNQSLLNMPQEEGEKYLALFKRVLSGVPGRNLVDINFRPDQVMEGEEHKLLTALNNTALKVDVAVENFFHKVIDSLQFEGNYLILLLRDSYDIPFMGKDDIKVDNANEDMFSYIMASVCPVKLTKPALSYCAQDNIFHERDVDWVVTAPELGFMFPTFDDRAANIYSALYYTHDAAENHDDFITGVFNTNTPMPAAAQKEAFDALLGDALEDDCRLEVVQAVHEQMRERIEEKKSDKKAEPPTITKREVSSLLESCGVTPEHVSAFEEKYKESFGETADLRAQNIVDSKQFEVRTPDVIVRVNPERSDLVETRVINGSKYILIRADEGVEVNGVNISIADIADD